MKKPSSIRQLLLFLIVSAVIVICIALIIQGSIEKVSGEITPWNFSEHISTRELLIWSGGVYLLGVLIVYAYGKFIK